MQRAGKEVVDLCHLDDLARVHQRDAVRHARDFASGRRAEDGPIAARYPLTETKSQTHSVRTKRNIREADGTLVFNLGELSGGTLLTVTYATPVPTVDWTGVTTTTTETAPLTVCPTSDARVVEGGFALSQPGQLGLHGGQLPAQRAGIGQADEVALVGVERVARVLVVDRRGSGRLDRVAGDRAVGPAQRAGARLAAGPAWSRVRALPDTWLPDHEARGVALHQRRADRPRRSNEPKPPSFWRAIFLWPTTLALAMRPSCNTTWISSAPWMT